MSNDQIRLIAAQAAKGDSTSELFRFSKSAQVLSEEQRTKLVADVKKHQERVARILRENPDNFKFHGEPQRLKRLLVFIQSAPVAKTR